MPLDSHRTQLHGIGALTAGKILGRVGTITRFRSAAALASYTGTAPIEVSSGDVVRHRLSRAGDRQLNYCLHVMALTQIRLNTPGRAYYLKKRSQGKGHKEAMRCLKRRPVRQRVSTTRPRRNRYGGGPGRTPGDDSEILRGQLNPAHRHFRTSHSDPPATNLQLHRSEPLDAERRHYEGLTSPSRRAVTVPLTCPDIEQSPMS